MVDIEVYKSKGRSGTAVYGTVRTVVWEDGGREAPSYPVVRHPIAPRVCSRDISEMAFSRR